jgi:hypothetical protein
VGSFRRRREVCSGHSVGVTACRGFVSRPESNWLRFVETLQLAVGSFRRGTNCGLPSEVTAPHSFPRSPWECRPGRSASSFGTGPNDAERRGRHAHAEHGTRGVGFVWSRHWVRSGQAIGVTACRGFVSRRRGNWVRFVEALQIAVGSFRDRVRLGFVLSRHSFRSAKAVDGTDYRGFDSSKARFACRLPGCEASSFVESSRIGNTARRDISNHTIGPEPSPLRRIVRGTSSHLGRLSHHDRVFPPRRGGG